jgi:hypothetical protein
MQAKMKEIKTPGKKKIINRKIYRAERHKEEMEMMIKGK